MRPFRLSGTLRGRCVAQRAAYRPLAYQQRWAHDRGQQPEGSDPSSDGPPPLRPGADAGGGGGGGQFLKFAAVFALGAGGVYYYNRPTDTASEEEDLAASRTSRTRVKKTKERKPIAAAPTEQSSSSITTQHDQVRLGWESPGVYIWGSNAGKVVAPDSNEAIIKAPQRVPYFDGQVLRDLKLRHNFGAAINEKGSLVVWGAGVSPTEPQPTVVLGNKDLVKLAVSSDRIIALSSGGNVYSIPASRTDQLTGAKAAVTAPPPGGSWFPFWSSSPGLSGGADAVNYRLLEPSSLRPGEKVIDIRSGLQHCLMLTSAGRVFSSAASALDFPSKGQLGVPGLTWDTRPAGPYDQVHEVACPVSSSRIVQIATGDHHSAMLDGDGRLFVFGDNTYGQLGYSPTKAGSFIDRPAELNVARLYGSSDYTSRTTTSLVAGGAATFFMVDTNRSTPTQAHLPPSSETVKSRTKTAGSKPPTSVVDVWACGNGIFGTLGTGKFVHSSQSPSKLQDLSSLSEFDEATGTLVPLKISQLSVGTTHACAVMATDTNTSGIGKKGRQSSNASTDPRQDASERHDNKYSAVDDAIGRDVLFWGGNEYYQLNTGKRNNINRPIFVPGLDAGGDSRLQLTPRRTVQVGEGRQSRKLAVEQKVECGAFVTAVYSAT